MLEQLKKALAEKVKGLDALETRAFATDATEEETKALETALSEIEDLKKQIATAETIEALRRDATAPAGDTAGTTTPASAKSATEPAQKLGAVMCGMIKAYRESGAKGFKATASAMSELGHESLANDLVAANTKSMNSVDGASGGVMIPETFAPDVIGLLYPMSSFMSGDPTVLPMPRGSYRQAKGASGATAAYRGEGVDIQVSNPTLKDINMTAHLLSGIVPLTNQLISYSLGAAERFARTDLAMAMSTKMDMAGFLGTGVDDDPTGIMNAAGVYSVAATNSTTPTQAQVDADARKLLNRFTRYPILRQKLAWRMSVTTKGYLEDMTDGNGNYIYPELRKESPRWKGYPVEVAGTFPENLGAGTNETYLALISFGHVLVGDAKGLEFAISDQASIKVGNDMVSMFSTDQTAIRATMEHDFTTRYYEAVAYLTGVKWGNA